MNSVPILALLILLVTYPSFSQENQIQGKITNMEEVEGIHVLNTSSRFNSVTDAFGNFSITAKPLDTLLFSSVHYAPKKVLVSAAVHERGILVVTLEKLINELDEVFLGQKLTGDLNRDVNNIKVKRKIDFDSLGIPGFKGEPKEKIPTLIGQTIGPTHVNIEALYNHISGYYKMLRTKRKWEGENTIVAAILYTYEPDFFVKAYQIPIDRTYDFLLFCVESSTLVSEFKNQRFSNVLDIFEQQSAIYLERLEQNEQKKE